MQKRPMNTSITTGIRRNLMSPIVKPIAIGIIGISVYLLQMPALGQLEFKADKDCNIRTPDIVKSVDDIAARRLGSGW